MCFFTEGDPQEQCSFHIWRFTVVSLATAAVVLLFLSLTLTAVFRCIRVSMPSGAGSRQAGVCEVHYRPSYNWEAHESLFHKVFNCITIIQTEFKPTNFVFLQFKRQFVPARAVSPTRPARHQCICPHHVPYLTPSVDSVDFRGIL